ncbi:helix-turn-helix domain-containing protein [Microbacterium sp. NPDC007973]|uniref:helix-turn-helix domain-containing protein n=1 Tax=Microbacterium sp. NPDC007973 TaxID=3364182 RepID=UPI0036E9208F
MARPKKTPHPFDRHLGNAVRAMRSRRQMTQSQLAEKAGIPLSNYQRREDGANETTVAELERISAALNMSSREIVDMALIDYNGGGSAEDGLRKLVESVSEAPRTVTEADNVTYLGHVTPGLRDAANTDERPAKDD